MKRLFALAAALCACCYAVSQGVGEPEPRWWRGNTHTHTLWSDGDAAPEWVADWYRSNGYHFLVLSDHNVLSVGEQWFPIADGTRLDAAKAQELVDRFGEDNVALRMGADGREMRLRTLEEIREAFEEPNGFLMIQGEEITDLFEERAPVHVNGINLGEVIPPQGGGTVREMLQRNVDAVYAQGERLGRPVLAHVNHPNFHWGLSTADVASICGEAFFEVYNGHPSVRNEGDETHASTEAMWDLANTLRLGDLGLSLLFGLATDDAHHYFEQGPDKANVGRGWVMVRAGELTPDAIIDALRAGDFYASSGVELEDVAVNDSTYELTIAAEEGVTYTTTFVGTRGGPDGIGEVGEVFLTTRENPARYRFRGDELFVRARVVSDRPHPNPYAAGDLETAWLQPVVPADR